MMVKLRYSQLETQVHSIFNASRDARTTLILRQSQKHVAKNLKDCHTLLYIQSEHLQLFLHYNNQHTNLSSQVIEDVREHLGDTVYQTVIPRNITLAEAPSFGKPVIFYDLRSAGAKAYLALAREVVSRG